MQRKQNTQQWGYPCNDRREAEGNRGALSMPSRRDGIVCGADSQSALKTLNRRMPNGTYGGVGGRLLN